MIDCHDGGMGDLLVLGLTDAHERVFEVLATAPRRRPEDIAAAVGITVDEAGLALQRLLRMGLAVADAGGDGSYSAPPVELAVDALVRAQQENLDRAQTFARDLAQRAARTTEVHAPQEIVSVVVGREAMGSLAQQVQRSARDEVLSFDRPPYYAPDSDSGRGIDREQVARMQAGVRYRTVFDEALLDDPAIVSRIRRDAAGGEDGRILENLPLKLLVVDRTLALLPLIGGSDADTDEPACLLIRPSVLVDSLVALFEAIWRVAAPLRLDVSGDDLTQEERELRQVVGLMAAGLGDARIAHMLGISERTVRRKVAAALERLGAQSRFQAGVRAREIGWTS